MIDQNMLVPEEVARRCKGFHSLDKTVTTDTGHKCGLRWPQLAM